MRFARRLLAAALCFSATAHAQQANLSAPWWVPAEAGWGLFVSDQGSAVSAVWYTNDDDGEPTWFIAQTQPQGDGSYAGNLYRFTGVPLAQIQGAASNPPSALGLATLRPGIDGRLAFTTTIAGATRTRNVERIPVGTRGLVCRATTAAPATLTNYSDIWWNPQSSGWGVHISHYDDALYGTWYTYDTDGEAIYYSSATTRQADGSYTGKLFRSKNGTPYANIAGAPASAGSDEVGTATFRFTDGSHASYSYTIGNVTQTKTIERLQFGNVQNVCATETFAINPGASTAPSDTVDCIAPYHLGDTHQMRTTSTSGGQSTVNNTTLNVARIGPFQGQSAFVEESTTDGVLNGRSYLATDQDTTVASFGADAVQNGSVISTSVNEPLRLALPRRFKVGEPVELRATVRTTGQGFATTSELVERWTLIAKEPTTTPAGTIPACRFTYHSEVTNASFGLRTVLDGTRWTSPTFGLVGRDVTAVSTVAGQTTTVTARDELVTATVEGQRTPN
jgi:hypothetical protein